MRTRKSTAVKLIAFTFVLVLITFGSVTAGTPNLAPMPAGKDWSSYGGDFYNQRFSTLNQINTGNVKDLKAAWTFHINYGEARARSKRPRWSSTA